MPDERTAERQGKSYSDVQVRRRFEEDRRKELSQHKKEAEEIIGFARGAWGFDEAKYDTENDTLLLRRGNMSVDLGMERNGDSNRRHFIFNLPTEGSPRKRKTIGEQIGAFLGFGKPPMNVREATEIRKVPLLVDPKGSSETRKAMVFDGDNKPGKLLALVFIEREGVPVPESWKLVERGSVRPPLEEGKTIAGIRPAGDWYIDIE